MNINCSHIFIVLIVFVSFVLAISRRRWHNLGHFSSDARFGILYLFFILHLARSSFACYPIHSSQVMKAIYVVHEQCESRADKQKNGSEEGKSHFGESIACALSVHRRRRRLFTAI